MTIGVRGALGICKSKQFALLGHFSPSEDNSQKHLLTRKSCGRQGVVAGFGGEERSIVMDESRLPSSNKRRLVCNAAFGVLQLDKRNSCGARTKQVPRTLQQIKVVSIKRQRRT